MISIFLIKDKNDPNNLYKFNLYELNDLIVIISDLENETNLIDNIARWDIDLVLTLNVNSANFLNSIRHSKGKDLLEKRLSDINEFNSKLSHARYRISFRADMTQQQIRDDNSAYFRREAKETAFTLASLDKFTLRPAPHNLKYTNDDRYVLSTFLLKNLNYSPISHERIALVCK